MTNKKTINTENHPGPLKIFASMMYEGMLLFGLTFVGAYIFDTLTQSHDAERLMWQRQFILFLLIGLYFIACWIRRGQTLPMKTWGIALHNKHHPNLSWTQVITRYLLMWVIPLFGAFVIHLIAKNVGWNSINMFIIVCPFLNIVPSLFRKDHQMLHDVLVGTKLINVKS